MVYGEVDIDGEEYYFGASNDGSMKVGLVKVISESNANTPSSTKTESYYLYKDNGMRVREGWEDIMVYGIILAARQAKL